MSATSDLALAVRELCAYGMPAELAVEYATARAMLRARSELVPVDAHDVVELAHDYPASSLVVTFGAGDATAAALALDALCERDVLLVTRDLAVVHGVVHDTYPDDGVIVVRAVDVPGEQLTRYRVDELARVHAL